MIFHRINKLYLNNKKLENKVNDDLKSKDSNGRTQRDLPNELGTSILSEARQRVARSIREPEADEKINTHLNKRLFDPQEPSSSGNLFKQASAQKENSDASTINQTNKNIILKTLYSTP